MNKTTNKMKMTKCNFETMLKTKFTFLTKQLYQDTTYNQKTGNFDFYTMTLYYSSNKHIASWQNGIGWLIK